jgi:hypothetical protein
MNGIHIRIIGNTLEIAFLSMIGPDAMLTEAAVASACDRHKHCNGRVWKQSL